MSGPNCTGPEGPVGPEGPAGPAGPPGPGSETSAVFLSAGGGALALTNGATDVAQVETTTNKVNYFVVNFPTGSQTSFSWQFALEDYDGGTFLAIPYWTTDSASTNDVQWAFDGIVYTDGDLVDAAFGAAVNVVESNAGALMMNSGAISGPITFSGVPAPRKVMIFRASRVGTGLDTLAAVAKLVGVLLIFNKAA
jgi:hypothetical protein